MEKEGLIKIIEKVSEFLGCDSMRVTEDTDSFSTNIHIVKGDKLLKLEIK